MKASICFLALTSVFAPFGEALDLFVSTSGSDNNDGSSEAKAFATLGKAQQAVRATLSSQKENINVRIGSGVHYLKSPLLLTASDSGKNGFTVNWVGNGATLSGGIKITNWVSGANGIYSASIPTGTKSRNLYVNGQAANFARRKVNRRDLSYTTTSVKWTNSANDWITSTQGIENAEIRWISSFTDRYSPIQKAGNKEVIMKQNAWFLNNWGYDTVNKPNADFGVWVQNALGLLSEGGQFFVDSAAGKVYYKPLNGENLSSVDAYLGVLETLVSVSGTYGSPAENIQFQNISFAHSTWMRPSELGYVDQQTGGHMCENKTYTSSNFESARPWWCQMQSAVQISAAKNIVFTGGSYTQLGGGGVGIGNDANAHVSGVGLGADTVAIRDGYFAQVMGNSITAGGIRADSHHPSNPAMTNTRIEISGNIFKNVSALYSSTVPIFGSYLQYSNISHNDIDIAPYSGICYGYGWGSNDAGGSPEYVNRGLYNFQPKYTTPTTSKNNLILGNLIHRYGLSHTDLGALYTLSKSPETRITENYAFDSTGFGMYTDEGSNSYSITSNILLPNGIWLAQNGQNTANNVITDNYGKSGGNRQGNFIISQLSQASVAARKAAYRAGVLPARRAGRPVSNPNIPDGFVAVEKDGDSFKVTVHNFDDAKFSDVVMNVQGAQATARDAVTEIPANSMTTAMYKAVGGNVKVTVQYTNSRTGEKGTLEVEKTS
ncbi:hypothetical protein GQ44DRAFT_650416 [Phaeosphaeriaceae sp. PMI808]|nr:hypothetical protein GQ44DRAFT_650416 [Phaeosphaeriaceae sp. PMI808]